MKARNLFGLLLLAALAAVAWQGCGRTRRPPLPTPAVEPVARTSDAVRERETAGAADAPVAARSMPLRPEPRRDYFHLEENVIHNAGALGPFFSHLQRVDRGELRKVDVVHLGDSHVQADMMTVVVREGLQAEFGAAGRGLVFPHRVAHTNGAADVLCWSNVDWSGRRLSKSGDMSVGASGFGALPKTEGFWLKVGLAGEGPAALFDRVRVFAGEGASLGLYEHDDPRILETTFPELPPEYYVIRSGDYLSRIADRFHTSVRRLKAINGLDSDRIYAGDRILVRARGLRNGRLDVSRFRKLGSVETRDGRFEAELTLEAPSSTIFVRSLRPRGTQTAPLYGFYLENTTSAGVVVSGVGSNGARYRDYANEEAVLAQLGALEPALVLISLGTNEATNTMIDPVAITAAMDSVLTAIRRHMPEAVVLLSTPPDHLERRRLSNLKVRQMRRLIVDFAETNDLAWWDLHEVMGGAGSMERWYEDELARQDRIHFTAEGYRLQGELLVAALLRAYDRYVSS